MNFSNKMAVIIGGTSGIGFHVAQQIIAGGGKVFIGGRSSEKLEQCLLALGQKACGAIIDNTDKKSIRDFFAQTPAFDFLFSPGATYSLGPIDQISDDVAESPFRSKFWGQYYAVKEAQSKISKTGSIVLMSGAASARPLKFTAAYAACNAAIEGLGRALAIELAPIRVNVVSPGTVDSDLWRNRPSDVREQAYNAWKNLSLTNEVIKVESVSNAVCFLLTNEAMTGSTLFTDGGYTLR